MEHVRSESFHRILEPGFFSLMFIYSCFILRWIHTSTLLDVLVSVSIVCRRSGGLKRTTEDYKEHGALVQ